MRRQKYDNSHNPILPILPLPFQNDLLHLLLFFTSKTNMSNKKSIKFVLDDKLVEIHFSQLLPPTTTVLNYLRSLPNHKGVKEGCAEGDCGACTVVVVELDGRGGLIYKAINSCLVFLPMIHGKQLITIENLAVKNGNEIKLHPVQKALVDHDGSQCGYCTPGMAMSLFALHKNHKAPAKEIVEDSLVGNLCRCTGYRPIIDAATEVCSEEDNDLFIQNEEHIINLLQELYESTEAIEIRTETQTYLKPFTVIDTLKLRRQNPDAIIISGATDTALLQTKKHILLSEILDISGLDELKLIVEDHLRIVIGTGISLEEVREYCITRLPAMSDLLRVFGSLQIRNMATMGGNVMSASPIGDTLPLLIALDAKVRLLGNNKQREMLVEDFITEYRKTDIHSDEILALVIILKPRKNEIVRSYKISKRMDLDISTVSACFKMVLKQDRTIKKINIVFGGVADMPKRAVSTMGFLIGKEWSKQTIDEAAKLLETEFNPITDARASAEARRIMAKNLLLKFWMETESI